MINSANRARWITLAVLITALALVVVLASRPSDDGTQFSPVVGQPTPPLQGQALDGEAIDLASYQGQWVVVNFFATWCIPCRQEHPELIAFDEQHSPEPDGPRIVAVAFDRNDISATRSFFAQNGGEWPVVPDDDGRIAVAFGVRGLPESFVVNPEGVVVERISGAVTAEQLNAIAGQTA